MKRIGRIAQYAWQDYETSADVMSELKISPVVKKIQNYRTLNRYKILGKWTATNRQTNTLNCEYQPCGKRTPGRTIKRLQDC